MFVKIKPDNTIDQYPYTLETFRAEHRNTSFPDSLSNALLEKYNVFPVRFLDKPDHDSITEYTYPNDNPEFVENEWVIGWSVGQKDANWLSVELEEQKKAVRKQRDDLLTETDWLSIRAFDTSTAVSDDWNAYRQSLRDVTSQAGFPWNIIWPEKPSS